MTSTRERAVKAVHDTLAAALSAEVARNAVLPDRVPDEGLVVVRDGDPGEPDVSLNPRTEYYTHAVEIEAYVRQPRTGSAEALLDGLLADIGNALLADPTLGGAVETLRLGAPEIEPFAVEGARPLLAARFSVFVEYLVTDPLTG